MKIWKYTTVTPLIIKKQTDIVTLMDNEVKLDTQ